MLQGRTPKSSLFLTTVQSLSRVRLFVTPWTAARQASLSITSSQSLLKLMSIESVMPHNHLILCCPLLLLPSVSPSCLTTNSSHRAHGLQRHIWKQAAELHLTFNGLPLDAESYGSDLSASFAFPVPGHTWTAPTRLSITQEVLKYQVLKIHATFPLKARA